MDKKEAREEKQDERKKETKKKEALHKIPEKKVELTHKEKEIKRGHVEHACKGNSKFLLWLIICAGLGFYIGKSRGNVVAGVCSGIIIAFLITTFLGKKKH